MASEYIASVIGEGANKEIQETIAKLDVLAKKIVEINDSIRGIEKKNIGNTNSKELLGSLSELQSLQKQIVSLSGQVDTLTGKLAKLQAQRASGKASMDAETRAIIEQQKNRDANIKQTQRTLRSIEKLTKARQKEEVEIAKQNNAYEQLKVEYREAANAAKKLGAEYFNMQRSGKATTEELRKMGQAVRDASKNALGLHKGLFDIEQATGQSQRNVGNYNALMFETNQLLREAPNFALSARTGFMALSNNLPMFADQFRNVSKSIDENTGKMKGWRGAIKEVGKSIFSWQTLLIVGITLLLQYGDRLFGASKAAKEAEERQKALNEAYKSGRDQAAGQISKIKELNDTMTNANLSMKQRTAAYEEAVKLYPSYLSKISKEDALTGGLADTINKELIPAILNAAKARGLENKLTKLYEQEFEIRDKLAEATKAEAKAIADNDVLWSKQGKTLSKVWDVLKGIGTAGAVSSAASVSRATKQRKEYLDAVVAAKKEEKEVAEELQKQLELTGKLNTGGEDVNSKAAKQREQKQKEYKDYTQDIIDEQAKSNAKLIQNEAAKDKTMYENTANSLEMRLAAYDRYMKAQVSLYELGTNHELTTVQNGLKDIQGAYDKAMATEEYKRTDEQKSTIQQYNLYSLQLQNLIKDHNTEIDTIYEKGVQERHKIIVSGLKAEMDTVQAQMNGVAASIKQMSNERLAALNESYRNDEISYKEYLREKRQIQSENNTAIYKAEVDFLDAWIAKVEQTLSIAGISDEVKGNATQLLNYIKELKAKLNPGSEAKGGKTILEYLGFGKGSDEDKKKLIAQQVGEIYESLFDVIDAQREAYYQKRFDLLDEEKERVEANAQAEKDAINSSLMSQEEKNKALAKIDAETAAREKSLDLQRRQLQRRQAVSEKHDAEFKIAIDGAIAIAKIFSDYGWPGGIIPAALQAGLTAAQLAVVAARPIPQYWQGTDSHPGGLAIVGERGTELVNLPSGDSFMTPSTATLMDLPRNTEVIPHMDLLNAAHKDALNQVNMIDMRPVNQYDYAKALIGSFEKNISRLEQTIQNKQEVHFYWKNGELKKSVKNGSGWTHYLDEG